MRKRGFTLIELLVVIAIIAVLAAILFPVFAEAREKGRQTVCVSNQRQLAAAVHLYLNDHDETFPMGLAQVSGGYYDGEYPVPVDWRLSQASNPALIRAFQSHWSHALQPYIKSLEIYRCPSAIVLQARGGGVEADYANAVKPPAPVSYSYNGLLHGLPLAQVERPTQVILWWESRGKVAVQGFARTSPYLFCPIEPCQYRRCPTRCAEPVVGDTLYGDEFTRFGYIPPLSGTLWMHSRGAVFAYVDGSVRWHPVGRQVQPARTDWRRDPFALYSERGFPLYAWYDGCYPWHFRPDNQ
jgi:prepilin-type N-terminal cleavage/methylation domain-containing protein/prepilin-type processing-associated H-X9-DG protein